MNPAETTSYGVYPETHELVEDGAQRTLTVRNRFYSVTHSLAHGGAVSGIVYHHGPRGDLLLAPCAGEVALAGGPTCSEANDTQATVEVRRAGDDLVLAFAGALRTAEGQECGIEYRHVYVHRWGHVRVTRTLRFRQPTRTRRVCVHSWVVRPELTHYGYRPAAAAEGATWTGAFGVCQWGRFAPGAAFDSPCESRYVPRYVCCADPGREGLEWFVGSDLSQWDYQLAQAPGHGRMSLAPRTLPPAVTLSVCPLDIPRGGVVLDGEYTFDSYLGVPIISGRANRPFLHKAFNRKSMLSAEQIRRDAERGVGSLHFHHDGDSFRDGVFWRDGSYPPLPTDDLREYDRVIADCHRYGIRVATYFSNKELHPTVQAYKDHGARWARLPDTTWEQLHNAYSGDEYGAQMCLRSGWLEYHKEYIDRVLSHHALDGTYFDWNVALYCHNTRHVAGREQDELVPGNGDWALSPAGHWDMDELLELMAWTRRRVGPDGLMIVHNTMVPMAATENYANGVVAMEWGYSRLASGAPDLCDLPLEWTFMGHRARGVIGYGCLEQGAPERVHRQMTVRALLSGVAPWPVDDLALDMAAPLRGRDLSRYRFMAPGITGQWPAHPQAALAVYDSPDEVVVLVGNLAAQRRAIRCRVDVSSTSLPPAPEYRVLTPAGPVSLSADQLQCQGVEVSVDADGLAAVTIGT